MGKKKKRGGGGGGGGGGGCGGGGGGQQQKTEAHDSTPAEERNEQAVADEATATGEGQGKAAAAEDKDKDKEKNKKALPPVVTAVLKVDMHCDGCAKRIRGSIRRFPGVEGVAMEVEKGTMTVVGRFDAKKLRDRVANKTKKKVDLVGNNNKGGGGGGGGDKGGGGGGNQKCNEGEVKPDKEEEGEERQQEEKGKDNKGGSGDGNAGKGKGIKDNKKPVVPVVGTVVLKIGDVGLHCDGCMNRIRSKLFKIKGVEQVSMEKAKDQVTVTGTMDTKALPERLRKKLRRPVDVVPANNNNKQQDSKEEKEGKQQGGNKDKDKEAADKALAAEMELWKAAFYDQQGLQATEFLLSDENPNACSLM